jgi:hypothetical protein
MLTVVGLSGRFAQCLGANFMFKVLDQKHFTSQSYKTFFQKSGISWTVFHENTLFSSPNICNKILNPFVLHSKGWLKAEPSHFFQ